VARGGYAARVMADMLREEHQIDGALSDIFEREPPSLTTFVTDRNYLNNPRLSTIQYDFVHILEQVYRPETYIAMVEAFGVHWVPAAMKHMLVLEWGKGSGKDHVTRIGTTRIADLLMCLRSPQAYYGLAPQDDIHLLNVAASADQARRAFFAPMKRLFVTTPVLAAHFRNGTVPGEQATSIQLAKGVELVSGHSLADTQEGLNLLVGIADEISAFKTKDELARAGLVLEGREAKTAEGIVKMLRTSARTRFPDVFKVAQISYPRFKGDAIEQSMDIGRRNITRYGEDSQYYISGPHATWDVNPRVSDRKSFEDDYNEDPEMAQAMYECRPPSAVNRFMRDDVRINTAFLRSIPDPITVEYYWGLPENVVENALAPDEKRGWQIRFHFHPDLVPMDGAAYALHGDLAGIAMSHIRTYTETQPNPDGETLEPRPIIRNDFVFSFEADLAAKAPDGSLAPREVQIRWYRQLVWDLIARGFYVASVTFDGFQSADMIQVFKSRSIESAVLSLDRNDAVYQTFKDVIYDGRLEGYYRLRVKTEVEGLRRLPNRKIDHPPNGSKDEADALAGSVVGAIEIGGDEGEAPLEASLATFVFDLGAYDNASAFSMNLSFGPGAKAAMGGVGDLSELHFGTR
jgi:hypothetical protein